MKELLFCLVFDFFAVGPQGQRGHLIPVLVRYLVGRCAILRMIDRLTYNSIESFRRLVSWYRERRYQDRG